MKLAVESLDAKHFLAAKRKNGGARHRQAEFRQQIHAQPLVFH